MNKIFCFLFQTKIQSKFVIVNTNKLICKSLFSTNVSSSTPPVLKIYDLQTPLFKEILTDELVYLRKLFVKYNYELRIAGGAVRDLLLEKRPFDIDLATDALPTQMIEMFEKENVRILNLKGLKHGTVPVRIHDKENFEITTLRIDVKTYGRHAEVEFTNDWHKDAIRRDLTVNSLFLDFDGKVHDYVNGVEDINNKIVRFVGIPDKRVKEDYLRIMRYFRFYSRICDNCENHDKASLKAIKDNVDGLKIISGERILSEFKKILSQRFCDSFMRIFYDFKINKYIGLPSDGDVEKFAKVFQRNFNNGTLKLNHPTSLLSPLITSPEAQNALFFRLKLSNDEKYSLNAIRINEEKVEQMLKEAKTEDVIDFFKREFSHRRSNIDRPLKKFEAIELIKYLNGPDELIDKVSNIVLPQFSLELNHILEHVVLDENNQPNTLAEFNQKYFYNFNHILADLKEEWINSNFKLTVKELLDKIDIVYLKKYHRKTKSKK